MKRALLSLLLILLDSSSVQAKPQDGQLVQGYGFEGVIFTPEMIRHSDISWRLLQNGGLWTPSAELVLKAESALPVAMADKTKYPKPTRGPHYPKYYSAKNGTDLNLTKGPPDPPISDSEFEDNFLYEAPKVSYFKRQYIGVNVNGKRMLLLSFIYDADIDDPLIAGSWKRQSIEVLDGGDNFWTVLYDPASGTFSGWECNGWP